MRCLQLLCAIALAPTVLGCSLDEDSIQGVRGPCGQAEGNLLGCPDDEIETAEQACWKLVECGVIPLEHEENYVFDYRQCNITIGSFLDYRQQIAIECIEASSCDQLKTDNSPNNPSRGSDSLPLCLQLGDT